MKFSILTIGDEICIGQITNTNASWIANKMTSLGYSALYHSSIPDNKVLILKELDRLISESDVLIITGGLGPTHDDITKDVLVGYFNDELVINKSTLEYLEQWFESRGRKLNEINRNQAYLPSKCNPLKNNVGTAPGMLFEKDNKLILSLPGVPAEMKSIFDNEFNEIAIDFFNKNSTTYQIYLTINTAGIFESNLAELIGPEQLFPQNTSLAYLPSAGKVRLRIGAKGESKVVAQNVLSEMQTYVESRIRKYIVGYGNDSILNIISKLLIINNLTVSVAESCTGGLFGASLTSLSGSSMFFKGGIIAYSNEIKINELDVPNETIENYGAVSEETALLMAQNVRLKFKTDIGISITGIAGPTGGTTEKPVGTVWIAYSDSIQSYAKLFKFGNDRELNRERAVSAAQLLLKERLNEL